MAKFITDKDLIAAARLLHEHFKKSKPCKVYGCIFRMGETCIIGHDSIDGFVYRPEDWELDKLEDNIPS
jgi:hypothetical protein